MGKVMARGFIASVRHKAHDTLEYIRLKKSVLV